MQSRKRGRMGEKLEAADAASTSVAPATPTTTDPRRNTTAFVLLSLTALFWSGNHVLGRAIAGEVPPLGISTLRWLIPMLILWPFVRPNLGHDWPLIRKHWRLLLGLGLTGGALFSGLQYVGLQLTTALNVSVINSLTPVFIVVAGALIFGDRLHTRQVCGILTSMAGVLVIVAHGDIGMVRAVDFNAGDLIIVFNMAVFGMYSAYLRKVPPLHWLTFLFVIAGISVVGTTPFFIWEHLAGYTFKLTWLTIAAIAYIAIFPSVLAFAFWTRGVALIGANRAGPFLHLIPLYSAVLANILLGEALMAYHVLGFALILAGVWFATRRG
jgi:drug/metabolite transporter (DMT)-like permease